MQIDYFETAVSTKVVFLTPFSVVSEAGRGSAQ